MPLEVPPTQRAYTLCLHGADKNDHTWRDALWATHEAVNKGARVFGDWLLTLRGGLDHRLADEKVKAGRGKADRAPSPEERRDRRVLLALSWLSVEDERGAPEDANLIVAYGDNCRRAQDNQDCRNRKVAAALYDILTERGVASGEIGDLNRKAEDQPGTWLGDCAPSLSAAIREDAVWVNRSVAFDHAIHGQDKAKAREDGRVLLWWLFTDDCLNLPRKSVKAKKSSTIESPLEDVEPSEANTEDGRAAQVKSGKGAGQRTRHPFSHLFGAGKPFGKKHSLSLRDHWHLLLKPLLDATGIPLRAVRAKDAKNASNADSGRSPSELHREMFSKAASRLAQIWTKQKQQELEREQRKGADEALKEMEQCAAYSDALDLLSELCEQQREASGALPGFRITPRQIINWRRIVECWASISEQDTDTAVEARIEGVKALQDEDRDKKFGDVNLFIELADERFKPIWLLGGDDGKPDATLLERYVKGMQARADAVRLKVASYRHPDAYFNPVFCQFGNSRPPIEFGRLKALARNSLGQDHRAVGMLLWDPIVRKADLHVLNAVSRRFDREIGSASENAAIGAASLPEVSRRTRLGRAAAGLLEFADQSPIVAGVFARKKITKRASASENEEEGDARTEKIERDPEWNGTLSANRRSLADLGKLIEEHASDERAKRQRDRLRWTLIVSVELEPRGPWLDYVGRGLPEGCEYKKGRGGFYLNYEANQGRKGRARFRLARLPGLRLLSVDLGHRYAAACAVWETLSPEQMEAACRAAHREPPGEQELLVVLKRATEKLQKYGRRKGQPVEETTVYRRIGADTLPDGSAHAAPWARLDRQFLIKLQGEDRPRRAPTDEELCKVNEFRRWLGLEPLMRGREADRRRIAAGQVDELMVHIVRDSRQGLRRHGDGARIAYALTATHKPISGGRMVEMDREQRIEYLQDALVLWQTLANPTDYRDEWAREMWTNWVVGKFGGPKPVEMDGDASRSERKKKIEQSRVPLRVVAEQLVDRNNADLHGLWAHHWHENDQEWQKCYLRRLRDWILPRGKRKSDRTIRRVGGLGYTRQAAIRGLYQTLKAFRMRPEPQNLRQNVPEPGDESLAKFGQRILDALDRIRENRVKQLASRIVEAALGVGTENRDHWERGQKRPLAQIDAPRHAPCHAVVVENLEHYRPEQTRTRRENRGLVNWAARNVRKFLLEGCQLYGLFVDEVSAGYTSRQDSRTALPGVRCTDVPVRDFLGRDRNAEAGREVQRAIRSLLGEKAKGLAEGPFDSRLQAAVAAASRKQGEAWDRYVVALFTKWRLQPDAQCAGKCVRIPQRGGEVFVPVDHASPIAGGLQADLNAAANIGLKAVLDLDWAGAWWSVPVHGQSYVPIKDSTAGSAAIPHGRALGTPPANGEGEKPVNRWSDVSAQPLESRKWANYTEYWNKVEYRVIQLLREQAGLAKE